MIVYTYVKSVQSLYRAINQLIKKIFKYQTTHIYIIGYTLDSLYNRQWYTQVVNHKKALKVFSQAMCMRMLQQNKGVKQLHWKCHTHKLFAK